MAIAVAKTGVILAMLVVLLLVIAAMGYDMPVLSDPDAGKSLARVILEYLLLAPLLETGLMVLLFKLSRLFRGAGDAAFIFACMGLIGAPHPYPASGIFAFFVYAYMYLSYRRDIGGGRAYWGVVVAHACQNMAATGLTLAG